MQKFREIIDTDYQFKKLSLNSVKKDDFTDKLEMNGVAYTNIQELSEDEYIELLSKLGDFKEETDLKIFNYVYRNILLNIITDKGENIDSTYQPFSIKSLNIHIENSLNPIEKIPNYLTLYCKKYSSDIKGGETLIVSMKDILEEFNQKELDILRTSKIQLNNGNILPNNILAEDEKRDLEFLAFRDFGNFEKDWNIVNSFKTKEEIRKIAFKLYELLYSKENLYSIPWKIGDLYGIDNKKFLHLRTKQFQSGERYLQRLRII